DGVITGLALQSDGKIIAAGKNASEGVLARYNSDGSADPSFGTPGRGTGSFGDSDVSGGVGGQPGGEIVVVGALFTSGLGARLTATGALDTGFGSNGQVQTSLGTFSDHTAKGIALQPDGKIVVGAVADTLLAAVRYNPNGSLDDAFGTGGKATLSSGR